MKVTFYKLYDNDQNVIFESTNKNRVACRLAEEKSKCPDNMFRIVDYAKCISDIDVNGDVYMAVGHIFMNTFLGEMDLTELFETYNDVKINLSIKVKGGSTTI